MTQIWALIANKPPFILALEFPKHVNKNIKIFEAYTTNEVLFRGQLESNANLVAKRAKGSEQSLTMFHSGALAFALYSGSFFRADIL